MRTCNSATIAAISSEVKRTFVLTLSVLSALAIYSFYIIKDYNQLQIQIGLFFDLTPNWPYLFISEESLRSEAWSIFGRDKHLFGSNSL